MGHTSKANIPEIWVFYPSCHHVVGQWITKVAWSFGSRRGLLAYVYSGVFVWMNECLSGGKWLLYSTAQCLWPSRSDNGHVRFMQGENGHAKWECPCKLRNGHARWMQGENTDARWEWSRNVRMPTQGGKWSHKVDARWECPCKVGNGHMRWIQGENGHKRWECSLKLGNGHTRWTQGENVHARWEYPCNVSNGCTRRTQGENAYMRWKWSHKVNARWEWSCKVGMNGHARHEALSEILHSLIFQFFDIYYFIFQCIYPN